MKQYISPRSDWAFFKRQDMHSFYRLGCMGNIYDMVLEIKYTKKGNDFYRYLALRVQSVDLERENVRNGESLDYPLFTKKAAVQIYIKSHANQQTSVSHALKTLKEWRSHDFEEYILYAKMNEE